MKRTAFDEFNDKRIASHSDGDGPLMCIANGCPNRWTVDGPHGKCCSPHAWAEMRDWPRITEEQNWNAAERARAAPRRPVQTVALTHAEKGEILQKLRTAVKRMSVGNREWAHRLKEREEAGEVLTYAQRHMWRSAIKSTEVIYDQV